jgi:hypothetical protein
MSFSRKLDYKAEYECWCKNHLEPFTPTSSQGQHQETSLLNYSFLLDPSSKVHALHLDAVIQMRRVYQEAILHQAVSASKEFSVCVTPAECRLD